MQAMPSPTYEMPDKSVIPLQFQESEDDFAISSAPRGSGSVMPRAIVCGLVSLTAVAGLSVGIYAWAGSAPSCPEAAVPHGGRQLADLDPTEAEKYLAFSVRDGKLSGGPSGKVFEVQVEGPFFPFLKNPKPEYDSNDVFTAPQWHFEFAEKLQKLKEQIQDLATRWPSAPVGFPIGCDVLTRVVEQRLVTKIRPLMEAFHGHLEICIQPHVVDGKHPPHGQLADGTYPLGKYKCYNSQAFVPLPVAEENKLTAEEVKHRYTSIDPDGGNGDGSQSDGGPMEERVALRLFVTTPAKLTRL